MLGLRTNSRSLESAQPTTLRDPEVRQDVRHYLGALKDLGPGWEDSVAASFLARVERRLDAAVEARVEERLRKAKLRRGSTLRLTVCLVAAVPLTAIAGQFAGLDGILVVLGALLLLNWDILLPS